MRFGRHIRLTQAGPAPARFLPVAGRTIAASHRMKSATPRPFARLSQTVAGPGADPFHPSGPQLLFLFPLERVIPTGSPIRVVRPGVTASRSLGIQPLRVSFRGDGRIRVLAFTSIRSSWLRRILALY